MIEAPDFLPLGSVVNLKGNSHKLMVISCAVLVKNDEGETEYYDYSGCLFPEGLQGSVFVYFNHEEIENVYFRGFENDESARLLEELYAILEEANYKKGHPKRLGSEQ